MFEKILFATSADPTCDHAAKVAFDLARKYESQLTVFHVLGTPTRGFGHFIYDSQTGEKQVYDQSYIDWAEGELRTLYSALLTKAPEAVIETLAGTAHTEILRTARRLDADLIVMGAHAGREDRPYAGSTVQRVAKAARCPVLIVARPCDTCWGYFSNIVFGTDFSKPSMNAFKFALALAKSIGTKLYIFHALELGATGLLEQQTHVEDRIRAAEKRIRDEYVSQMGDFDLYEIGVWEGTPYVEVTKYARRNHADLIVMAHHTREVDADKALLGSTMEQVVLRSICPVMSVNHPDKVMDL